MKNAFAFALLTAGALSVQAWPRFCDAPDANHAWGLYDRNRPDPPRVEPAARDGLPPSDAAVLFGGNALGAWRFEGSPWAVRDGALVSGSANAWTKQSFGDCQLHVEWSVSPGGNSGILLGAHTCEVQILYSRGDGYADGRASAVYGQHPPLVNACRPDGEWQSYDITFHPVVWREGKCLAPGLITVYQNGILTQDRWVIREEVCGTHRQPLTPRPARTPIGLQSHGGAVRFRNVWVREIPPLYPEPDVAALRRETAARLYAGIDLRAPNRAKTLDSLLNILPYDQSARYLGALREVGSAYLAELRALDAPALAKRRAEIAGLCAVCDALVANRVIPADFELRRALGALIGKQNP